MRIKSLLPIAFLAACMGCRDIHYASGHVNPHPLKTQVSLSPSTTELALMYSHEVTIGRTASDNFPPQIKGIPVIMTGTHPDFELLSVAKPDCVIYDPHIIAESDIQKIQQMGITPIAIGGDTVQQFEDSLWKYGTLTNSETAEIEYVNTIEKKLADARTQTSGKHHKVAVLVPGNGSGDLAAGTNGFIADIIRRLGSEPVGPQGAIFAPANVEDLLKQDPDVILVAEPSKQTLPVNPGLQGTTAYKKKNVFRLDEDIALRQGGRVDQLIEDIGVALGKAG